MRLEEERKGNPGAQRRAIATGTRATNPLPTTASTRSQVTGASASRRARAPASEPAGFVAGREPLRSGTSETGQTDRAHLDNTLVRVRRLGGGSRRRIARGSCTARARRLRKRARPPDAPATRRGQGPPSRSSDRPGCRRQLRLLRAVPLPPSLRAFKVRIMRRGLVSRAPGREQPKTTEHDSASESRSVA